MSYANALPASQTELYSVTFWVKRYDNFNRMFETRVDDRDDAYRLYQRWSSDGNHYFVQMGAVTDVGSIVLNEWRKQEARIHDRR